MAGLEDRIVAAEEEVGTALVAARRTVAVVEVLHTALVEEVPRIDLVAVHRTGLEVRRTVLEEVVADPTAADAGVEEHRTGLAEGVRHTD